MAALVLTALSISPVFKDIHQSESFYHNFRCVVVRKNSREESRHVSHLQCLCDPRINFLDELLRKNSFCRSLHCVIAKK